MIIVSEEFKNALAAGRVDYLRRVTITLADETRLTLFNQDIWHSGVSLDDTISDDENFSALGAVSIGSARVIINNIYDTYTDYDFTDAVLTIEVGLELSEMTEWVPKGVYTVEEAAYNGSTITLSCLDNMTKFDRPYSDSLLIYPATLDTIVRNLCTICGVDLATSSLNFPRKNYVIPIRPSDKATTCREVLSWCATIAGCFARCNAAGELELRWFDANNTHTLASLYSQNISVDDVVITQITAEVKAPSEDAGESIQTYSSGTPGYAIKIANNDFLTPTNAQYVVNTLGTELIGLTFRKASVSHASDPTIEAGDCGTIIDRKGNEYPILITRTNFKVGSPQTTVCGAETPARNSATRFTETTKSYVELRKRLKDQKTEWEEAVEDLSDRIDAAGGLYETQVTQPGGGVITYLHNQPVLAESDVQIMISGVGVHVTANGTDPSPTWYGLEVDGVLIASILNAVGINADWINTGQLVIRDANQNETFFADVDTGTVRINASQLSINSQTINSMIDEASGLTLQTPYTWSADNQTANFSAVVYQGKEDITADCDASWFEWYLRKEGSETRIAVGKTVSVSKSSLGYGGTVVCKFTHYDQTTPLLTRSGAALETRSGTQLSTFSATATGEQKITDLPQKTASSQISASDNLLGIDAADGYQVSVQFFTDYTLETQTRTINGQSQTVVASINALGSAQTALAGRVTITENNITSLAGRMTTAENSITSVAGRVTTAEGNITSLDGRMTTAEGTIATHTTDIATNADDIDALESSKVDRAGDTMTGNLIVQSSASESKAFHSYATQTRGVAPSSNTYSGGLRLYDKNGSNLIGFVDSAFRTNGKDGIRLGTARTPTGGVSLGNSLYLFIDSSGNRTVEVSEAAPWITALGLAGIGTRKAVTLTSNKTLASATSLATLTNIVSVSLEAGTWILVGQISFPGGSGTTQTTRRVSISDTATGSNYGMTSIPVVNNAGVVIQVCATVILTSTTTIYLNAAQNSGSSMTITSGVLQRITAVRII